MEIRFNVEAATPVLAAGTGGDARPLVGFRIGTMRL
jgi:hypothetical protein